jgi:polysaccharide transporter, PST family
MKLWQRPSDHHDGTHNGECVSANWSSPKILHSGFIHNVIAPYGVQACTYALPLLAFPYLARVSGPSGWGAVVYAQAIGSVIASVVEYGFDISASRETSRQRDEPERLSDLISGVLGAKVLLAVLCIDWALFSRPFIHHIAPSSTLFWATTIWGSARASIWFGSSRVWSVCASPALLK